MYYRVLVASQRFHGKESLTYKSDIKLVPGQIVSIQLQNKTTHGVVESESTKPTFATKEITVSWPVFLPDKSLELLDWLYAYYPAPLGVIVELFTPPNLPRKISTEYLQITTAKKPANLPPLTKEQTKTLQQINNSKMSSFLIHGDTGTGKTRVYIELAKQTLDSGKSVIVLTPEIGLTGPLLGTFQQTFGDQVFVTHSEMTQKERRNVWLQASSSDAGLIIIGPRSAIFTPLKNIGLIIMDESHDSAYKQEQAPHYQTSRVAGKLANLHNGKFVMGTATPLVTDLYTFENKNLPVIRMTKPAIKSNKPSTVQVIDMRQKELFTKSPWISNKLLDAIGQALTNKEQSLLFLNRRGSARLVLCNTCGWQAMCPNCDVALTYHHDKYIMRCHSCEYSGKVPSKCPSCGGYEVIFRSIGTKALESEINKLFPGARVNRFDRDTEKAFKLNQQTEALQNGEIDILIGTQSIAKGFDLPNLSVVGIIQADSGLQIPDYTATERTFQLISQVSGRIGRGHTFGSLFVQTFDPKSPLIELALKKDYKNYYLEELKQRNVYKFPPYVYILKVSFSRSSSNRAIESCNKLSIEVKKLGLGIIIEGPSPRFVEKISSRYSWHLVFKAKNRNNLLKIIQTLPGNCSYDIDPSDLL